MRRDVVHDVGVVQERVASRIEGAQVSTEVTREVAAPKVLVLLLQDPIAETHRTNFQSSASRVTGAASGSMPLAMRFDRQR